MQRPWSRIRPSLAVMSALAVLSVVSVPALKGQDDDDGNSRVRVYSFLGRPRIGVTVDIRADKENDKIGARIRAVTPDGPADKAGLKEGDIITRFNGEALGGAKADDEDESGPGQRLVALARKLESGDTVAIEYRRGSESRKATLVAKDLSDMMSGFRVRVPDFQGMTLPRMERMPFAERGPEGMRVFIDGVGLAGGLKLADLNADLGEYFGAKEGVLVLETPADSTIPLKAGDVIVSIDGRQPTSESQARRIFRSYDAGETAKIEVMRKQRKVTLSWKMAEPDMKWRTPVSGRGKVRLERS